MPIHVSISVCFSIDVFLTSDSTHFKRILSAEYCERFVLRTLQEYQTQYAFIAFLIFIQQTTQYSFNDYAMRRK